jgi:predicted nucleic acid-binding protein
MILVDTSVWIEHLRVGSDRLKTLLLDEQVFCHPFVVGELAWRDAAEAQRDSEYVKSFAGG